MNTASESDALEKVALTTTLYKNIVTASKVPESKQLIPVMRAERASEGQ